MISIEMTEDDKQQEINKFLRDLSTNTYEDKVTIDKSRILLDVYTEGFRHSYASFLVKLINMKLTKKVNIR